MTNKKLVKRIAASFAAVIALAGVAFGMREPKDVKKTKPPKSIGNIEIHFLDVGQGDATLIKCGDAAMLIDAGENDKGTAVWNYLKKQEITKLDYVIGTHPDSDHIGGMDNIIKAFDIGTIYMPKVQTNTKTFEEVIDAISAK